ncbi:MAG: hypothetical protein WC464_00085 [Bdellovibrionales bacterium]
MNKKTYKKKPKECEMCGTVKEMTARGKWCSNRCKQENKNSKSKNAVAVLDIVKFMIVDDHKIEAFTWVNDKQFSEMFPPMQGD